MAISAPTAGSATASGSLAATIPFACTGCGKCCQTVGSVYLSPDDVERARAHLKLSSRQFIHTYASHTIRHDAATTTLTDAKGTSRATETTTPWVVLRDRTDKRDAASASAAASDSAATAASCIFLDTGTNQCRIYEARPTQCRTYPFWPSIVASVQDWNDECRRNSDGSNYPLLPEWTPDAGGCEGMRPIQIDQLNNDRWIAQAVASSSSSPSPECFTSTDDAIRFLYQYVQDHRRFPHDADEVPVDAASE
jgi:Fe-S-cluster containining protein